MVLLAFSPNGSAVRVCLKHLENHRRQEAGEPPIPLTLEEERYERETEKNSVWVTYWQKLGRQIEEYEFA